MSGDGERPNALTVVVLIDYGHWFIESPVSAAEWNFNPKPRLTLTLAEREEIAALQLRLEPILFRVPVRYGVGDVVPLVGKISS